jgi:hypothetical protein
MKELSRGLGYYCYYHYQVIIIIVIIIVIFNVIMIVAIVQQKEEPSVQRRGVGSLQTPPLGPKLRGSINHSFIYLLVSLL